MVVSILNLGDKKKDKWVKSGSHRLPSSVYQGEGPVPAKYISGLNITHPRSAKRRLSDQRSPAQMDSEELQKWSKLEGPLLRMPGLIRRN
jgi:hypothetical protein